MIPPNSDPRHPSEGSVAALTTGDVSAAATLVLRRRAPGQLHRLAAGVRVAQVTVPGKWLPSGGGGIVRPSCLPADVS
jgi:hypothetical protein